MASVTDYVTTRTYASTNDQWARSARPLVSSSKIKPSQFTSVQFSYVALYALLCTAYKLFFNFLYFTGEAPKRRETQSNLPTLLFLSTGLGALITR